MISSNNLSRRTLLGAGLASPLVLASAMSASADNLDAEDTRYILDDQGTYPTSLAAPRPYPSASAARTAGSADGAVGTDGLQEPGFVTVFNVGQHQDNNKYCGPAAVATALTNFRIAGVSQSTLASQMATNIYGSIPKQVANAMNRYIYNYPFWTAYRSIPGNDIFYRARNAMESGMVGGLLLVFSKKIWYPTTGVFYAHYLTITGFNNNFSSNGTNYGPTLQVWDPDQNQYHHLAARDLAAVMVGGICILP